MNKEEIELHISELSKYLKMYDEKEFHWKSASSQQKKNEPKSLMENYKSMTADYLRKHKIYEYLNPEAKASDRVSFFTEFTRYDFFRRDFVRVIDDLKEKLK